MDTKTYVGETATQAFDGYKGLRIDTRYTGTEQENGTVLVSPIGAPAGTGVLVSADEWRRWFTK